MSGEVRIRREASAAVYRCGCRWSVDARGADVLEECATHGDSTRAQDDAWHSRAPLASATPRSAEPVQTALVFA